MVEEKVDLWALDQVHLQQPGSRCRMWVPPETKDPTVYHHPTRKSVGYFAAVRLRDGAFLFRRETGRCNGETFWEFLKVFWGSQCRSRPPRSGNQRQRTIPSLQTPSGVARRQPLSAIDLHCPRRRPAGAGGQKELLPPLYSENEDGDGAIAKTWPSVERAWNESQGEAEFCPTYRVGRLASSGPEIVGWEDLDRP